MAGIHADVDEVASIGRPTVNVFGRLGLQQKIVAAIESSSQLKAAEKATADLKQKGYKVGVIGAP